MLLRLNDQGGTGWASDEAIARPERFPENASAQANRRRVLQGSAGLALAGLAGCTNGGRFLPSSGIGRRAVFNGPAAIRVETAADQKQYPYALIPLNQTVVSLLSSQDTPPRFTDFGDDGAVGVAGQIGLGDTVAVTIFESARGGLFLPAPNAGGSGSPGNYITLPPQQVDRSGSITIPFIPGPVRAAGRTPIEVERDIARRLANRALEPQVVISVPERRADGVAVVGDVMQSTRFSLDASGERILGAIARAGGPKSPAYETIVSLQRNGRTQRALLSEIAADPAQNIQVRPGDTIVITDTPRYFSVLGATGTSASFAQLTKRFPFDATRMNLMEAVAKAGGLQDTNADPTAVFLLRAEPRANLMNMGIQVPPTFGAVVPTIYTVDYDQPGAFFLSSQFPVRERDIIFISTAPAIEFNKFITDVLPFTTNVQSVRGTIAP